MCDSRDGPAPRPYGHVEARWFTSTVSPTTGPAGVNIIRRFTALGFDVVAYDSRAHGNSTGDACTYGYFEKDDLRLVLDQLNASNVVLLGTSLGAAVALQAGRDSARQDDRFRRSVFGSALGRRRAGACVFHPGLNRRVPGTRGNAGLLQGGSGEPGGRSAVHHRTRPGDPW